MEDEPRVVSFLKPAMRYAGMIKDNRTSFLTLRELNIKKNVSFTGGRDYLLYRWLPWATTAIFGGSTAGGPHFR